MIHQLKSYISYLLRATNQHGVHSPFVFDLVTQCLYDSKSYLEYDQLKKYRSLLSHSKDHLEITDFGAGSHVFKSNTRPVASIAKNAGITSKRQKLLFRLARHLGGSNYLELGTSLGLGTVALALGAPSANITSVEGCPETAAYAKKMLNQFEMPSVAIRNETFESFFENSQDQKYDLIYIDGNHDKEKTLHYFEKIQSMLYNNSLVIFDDIYWSPAMTEAWQEINADARVSVSIDTFHWGLIFFRREQEKQHFVIRM